ncbi:MAG TPA: WD40 repeat domain-containing protein [Oligoflexus sp.]|uniref:WD40 repeat domain-containing protein n=1 Tax=Oligoflexus sp. TaxID=1971216 RepID=UPI002D34EE34|nr:WD40 repeat domain-containing protein [Oligoflexus sp.]HYX31830.1 WD40 repeat domain-containing protein [Oligoflexus sp.]
MDWGFEEKKIIDTGSLISSMAVAPDGKRIVTGSINSSLTVWEIETGFKPHRLIEGASSPTIQSLALSSDESFVVSLPYLSNNLEIHYLKEKDKPAIRLEGSEESLTKVAISPQNVIIAGTDKGNIKIWDSLHPNANTTRSLTGHTSSIKALAFIDDGSKLISGSDDQSLLIHDLHTGKIVKSFTLTSPIEALAVSPSGTFASAQKNGEIDLWDVHTLQHLGKLRDPIGMLLSIDITVDGSRIVTGASNGVVRFWNIRTGISITQQSGFGEKIKDVRWLPSEQAAITGSVDQTLRIWDATTGRNISTWIGHGAGVNAMTLNKDATLAVIGGAGYRDEMLNVWDLSQDNLTRKLCAVSNVGQFEVCKAFQ